MADNKQLKTARITGDTTGIDLPAKLQQFEAAIRWILGAPADTDLAEVISMLATGEITVSTSLALPSGPAVTAIHDEDDMVSDDASGLATQQSIKAYVDANSGL